MNSRSRSARWDDRRVASVTWGLSSSTILLAVSLVADGGMGEYLSKGMPLCELGDTNQAVVKIVILRYFLAFVLNIEDEINVKTPFFGVVD
ncbi:hypothetical protein ACFQJ5_19640 [Halomicroarcula sp. GCM10025324]|uniref:hypothetical protein n=1 Tax=Halomicroarcula sp. GCM10025324 TaxID=3252667 RepID=UPI003615E5FE